MSTSKKVFIIIILGILLAPSFTVLAEISPEEQLVSTKCVCKYDKAKNVLDCGDCYDTDKIKEDLLDYCGGPEASLTSEIKYFCDPASGLKSLLQIDTARIKSIAFDSCQYHLMNTTKTYETGDIEVAAFSTCLEPSQILGANICKEEDVIKALTFIGYLLFFAKLLVPFIIILMGTMDYYKAITSDKTDTLKEQTQKFLKRLVIGFLIFFLPTIINTFLTLLGNYSSTISSFEECAECLIDPISCKK